MLRSTAGVIALCLMLSACGGVGETDAGPPGQSSGGTSNGTSTGTTGTTTTGGAAIMSHNAGQDCISCHKAGGAGASKGIFTVAGTVYNNNGGAQNNATVSIYAAGTNNVQATLSTDGLGNFWTTQAIAALVPAAGQTLVQGVNAVVRPTGGGSRSMLGVISNGSCNACHSSAGGVAKVTAQLLDSGPSVHTAAASGDGESGATATAAVESLPALAQIATGTAHGCVLKAAGSVLCWGANDLGQLGTGNTDTAQISIVSLAGVAALNAAGDTTCARVGTGNATSFYCWGAGFGATPALADVSAENAPAALVALRESGPSLAHNITAANVVGLESTSFTHIASAADHSCGITTENHVKCWEGTHASVDIPLL